MTVTTVEAHPLATMWARDEQLGAAAAQMHLDLVLRRFHWNHGVSQNRLAELTGLSAAKISKIINGRQPLTSLVLAQQALTGLGAPSSPAVEPLEVARPQESERALTALGRSAADLIRDAGAQQVGDWSAGLVEERLRAAADQYLTVPAEQVLADLVEIDFQVQGWRGRRLPLSQAREVWVLAGWHAALVGWICVDQGRTDLATTHAHAARVCAEYSGHDGVAAWAAMVRRTIAYWQQRRRQGAEHARAGLEAARRVGGGAHVIVLSALAQDQARLGEHDQALELLEAARRAMQEGEPTADSDLGGPLACTPVRACGYWAETYLDLGEPEQALVCAREGLEEAATHMVRNLGSERMLALHQALALARLGRAEEAMAVATPVLDTPASQRPQPLRLRLRQVGASLPAGVETRRFRERITAFTRT